MNDVDVIIHIGSPKTGTSALQKFFVTNQATLLDYGFFYPLHGLDRNGISGGHSELAVPLIKGDLKTALATFNRMMEEARRYKACLLLSAEGFYGQFDSFSSLLDGLNVRLVGWFRHPYEAFISNYNQSVKRHYQTQRLSSIIKKKFYKRQEKHLNGSYFHCWADSIGERNCIFLPYLYSLMNEMEPVENVFLKILGVPNRRFKKFQFDLKSTNKSYSPEALELKRLLNYVLSEEFVEEGHRVDWSLQNYSDQFTSQKKAEANTGLDRIDVKFILDYFSETNRLLALRFPNLQPLFQHDERYLEDTKRGFNSFDNLSKPWLHLSNEYPQISEFIRNRVVDSVNSAAYPPYGLLKLADLLNIDFGERRSEAELFPDNVCAIMLSEKSQPADLLREVSLMLERYGDYKNALRVIVRALELRPKGPAIIGAHQRLTEKLKITKHD